MLHDLRQLLKFLAPKKQILLDLHTHILKPKPTSSLSPKQISLVLTPVLAQQDFLDP